MANDKHRARQNARRRGAAFEKRIADILGGEVWRGEDGDVEAREYRIEAKYRANLQLESTHTLRDWIEQLNGYRARWHPEKRCALAFTGGAQSGGHIWVAIPIADFERLTRLDEDRRVVEHLIDKHGNDIELFRALAIAAVMALHNRQPRDIDERRDWDNDDEEC